MSFEWNFDPIAEIHIVIGLTYQLFERKFINYDMKFELFDNFFHVSYDK